MKRTNSIKAQDTIIRFGLRFKIFSLVAGTVGAVLGACIVFLQVEANKAANMEVNRSLSRSKEILNTRIRSRFNTIKETTYSLARDGQIQPHVYARDSVTLQDLIQELQPALDFELLFVVDNSGTVLARSDKPQAIGSSVADRSLIRTALSGEDAHGFMRKGKSLLQIVATPVLDNAAKDIVRGAIVVAYEVSPSLGEEIKRLTASDIAAYVFPSQNSAKAPLEHFNTATPGKPLMEAEFAKSSSIWKPILHGEVTEKEKFEALNEDLTAIAVPIFSYNNTPVGFFLALRARSEILAPFYKIQTGLILAGLAGLFSVGLLALILANRISRPILELVKVAEGIGEGRYPRIEERKTRDEIDLLRSALERMGNGLFEKDQLEQEISAFVETVEHSMPSSLIDAAPGDTLDLPNTKSRVGQNTIVAGRYQIEQLLGYGTWGEVYLAMDRTLQVQVALKCFPKGGLLPENIERFKNEVRLARQISHRNIVRTYDFGEDQEIYYISMEHVEGPAVYDVINQRGPMALRMGLLAACQMTWAVAAAHREGIVHQDLKPQNMVINRQGVIKLLDFGIAITRQDLEGRKKGETSGTPRYMSPEQLKDEETDARTDIYSLGVVFFFIFTGKYPHEASDMSEGIRKTISEEAKSITDVRADLPDELAEIISRCLKREARERFPTADALGEKLAGLLERLPSSPDTILT